MTKQEKFIGLYKPIEQRLERFALAMARNRETAKDVVADTVLIAYQSFESLKNEKAFLSYLFTIASRVYNKRLKDKLRTDSISLESADMLYSDNISQDAACDIELLYDAMEKLPDKQREAIILHEINGFTQDEISAIQDSGLSAVKMRIRRGRIKLAKLLGANENE